jgi:hypothetical protein
MPGGSDMPGGRGIAPGMPGSLGTARGWSSAAAASNALLRPQETLMLLPSIPTEPCVPSMARCAASRLCGDGRGIGVRKRRGGEVGGARNGHMVDATYEVYSTNATPFPGGTVTRLISPYW